VGCSWTMAVISPKDQHNEVDELSLRCVSILAQQVHGIVHGT